MRKIIRICKKIGKISPNMAKIAPFWGILGLFWVFFTVFWALPRGKAVAKWAQTKAYVGPSRGPSRPRC